MSNRTVSLRRSIAAIAMAAAMALSVVVRADELVDPTRPANARRSASKEFVPQGSRVSAIFLSGKRRVAVFDGKVVKAGDRVGEVFIETITADGVRYRYEGRVEFAALPKQAATVRRSISSEESEP